MGILDRHVHFSDERWQQFLKALQQSLSEGNRSVLAQNQKDFEDWKSLFGRANSFSYPWKELLYKGQIDLCAFVFEALNKNLDGCAGVSSPWELDIISPRKAVKSAEIGALLRGDPKGGTCARLRMELIEEGQGKIYPNPHKSGLMMVWEDFYLTIQMAAKATGSQNNFIFPKDHDIRWSLLGYNGSFIPSIDGNSIFLAFYLCLYKLLSKDDDLNLEGVAV